MMVGNNPDKTGKAKGGPRAGRTSPGLNVKRFTIPKKQKDLLNEVELDSSEYLREIQPIIQQGYRDSSSKNRFNYGKVQLVHNSAIKKEFLGKKREMKDDGRGEKELTESYAFLYVEKEEMAKKLCSQSVCADDITDDPRKTPRLGNPSMGVHVCRFSDIIFRNGFPQEGILVILKIIKGKVKTAPLNYSREVLEPTPNFDCHVAKSPAESDIHHFKLFDTSQIFVYDFDEEEVEFRKRPRNIYPYALVHFTYSKSGATGSPLTTPQTSSFNRKSGTSSNDSTPTRKISVPETAGVAVVAPCFPRNEIVTERPKQDKDRPFAEKYAEYLDRSYRVWTGNLLNKNNNSCRVALVSFGLPFLPCQMPDTLSSLKAVRIKDLKLPSKIFTGSPPMSSRVKEVQANGKYYWYAELHSLSVEDAVYHRFLNYISDKELVLKKEIKDTILMYILPTGKTSQKLGLTTSYHPKMMHCLIESYLPMVTTLTDVSVKQPRHQHKLNLESAPVHDIDTDHLKRLRFQSSLALLFYQQNKKLREIGVKGDEQTDPATVSPLRRTSMEMWEEQRDYGQEVPLPEHLAGVQQQQEWPRDDQRSQEWPQDNQRTPEWPPDVQKGLQIPTHPSPQHPNSHPSPHHTVPHPPSPYHPASLHPSPHHPGLQPSPHHHGPPPSSPHVPPYPPYPPVDNVSGHYRGDQGMDPQRGAEYPLGDRRDEARFGTPLGQPYPRGRTRDRHSSEHSIDYPRAPVQSERSLSQEQAPRGDVPRVERRLSQERDVPRVQRRPAQQKPELKQKRGRESLESPESPPPESRYPNKEPPLRQGSNHSTDSQQSRSSTPTEQRLGQESTAMSQQLEKHKSRMVLESPESPPPQDRRPGPWDKKPRPMDGQQGREDYERQNSAKRFKPHDKDRSNSQDGERELTPQMKDVASKVHDMLTGGINLGLPSGAEASASDSRGNRSNNNQQETIGPETEDQKLERMRTTLQSLVAERERLTKRQEQVWKRSSNYL